MTRPHRPFEMPEIGRAAAFGLVVVAHGALLAGLAQLTLARDPIVERDPLQVALVAGSAENREPPEPPKPQFDPPPVDVIRPEVVIEWAPEAANSAITVEAASERASIARSPGNEPVLVSEVQYVTPPRPSYPRAARKQRQEGLVMLKVVVDVAGRPAAVEVHESSGHPLLDSAACDAVKQTRFQPHVENGRARPMLVMVPIEFRLNDRVASSRAHGS